VKAQRLVPVPPRIARARVALHDDRGHAQLSQAGAKRDPALSAADDHDVRLGGVAKLLGLALALLQPRLAIRVRAVLHALWPVGA
jgi:hypothetical protein